MTLAFEVTRRFRRPAARIRAVRTFFPDFDGHHFGAPMREALPHLSSFHGSLELQLARPGNLALFLCVAFVDFGHVVHVIWGLLAGVCPIRKPASRDASRVKRSDSLPGAIAP